MYKNAFEITECLILFSQETPCVKKTHDLVEQNSVVINQEVIKLDGLDEEFQTTPPPHTHSCTRVCDHTMHY